MNQQSECIKIIIMSNILYRQRFLTLIDFLFPLRRDLISVEIEI